MNLATPAPYTEAAIADPAKRVEMAAAILAPPCEAAEAMPAPRVQPARIAVVVGDENRSGFGVLPIITPPPVSVNALRRTGIDFESYAAILQLGHDRSSFFFRIHLPCLQRGRQSATYGEVKKYIVVKDGICLVYADKHDPSPLYALPLDEMDVVVEDWNHPFAETISIDPVPPKNCTNPNYTTIVLRNSRDKSQVYQLSFNNEVCGKEAVKRFVDLVDGAPKVLIATASSSVVSSKADIA